MWLMKRAIVDGWDVDRAMEEAVALGLANESLKQFFLEQIRQRSAEPRVTRLVAGCVEGARGGKS